MNKRSTIIAAAMAAICAFAEEGGEHRRPPENRMPKKQMQGFAPNAGMWIPKMLSDKETLAGLGIADEAVAEKIASALSALETRGAEIENQIRDLSREQAKLFRNLLADKNADPKPVTDLIGRIAELRAEQGRIAVEAMVALRDNLTEEQTEKAFELIRKRGAERHRMRTGDGEPPFGPPRGPHEGRRGPGGRRRWHPDRDGGEGREPPPPPQDGGVPEGPAEVQ